MNVTWFQPIFVTGTSRLLNDGHYLTCDSVSPAADLACLTVKVSIGWCQWDDSMTFIQVHGGHSQQGYIVGVGTRAWVVVWMLGNWREISYTHQKSDIFVSVTRTGFVCQLRNRLGSKTDLIAILIRAIDTVKPRFKTTPRLRPLHY